MIHSFHIKSYYWKQNLLNRFIMDHISQSKLMHNFTLNIIIYLYVVFHCSQERFRSFSTNFNPTARVALLYLNLKWLWTRQTCEVALQSISRYYMQGINRTLLMLLPILQPFLLKKQGWRVMGQNLGTGPYQIIAFSVLKY
jgi:hypothetical protein